MTAKDIEDVESEIKRFKRRLEDVKVRIKVDSYAFYGCRETAALKRASMDLSNELVKLRK